MYWVLSNILILKVIAHGDYCDLDPKNGGYIIQKIDFTRDIEQLQEFVEEVGNTHGGDAPECYELVLKHAREEFSWREGEDCKSPAERHIPQCINFEFSPQTHGTRRRRLTTCLCWYMLLYVCYHLNFFTRSCCIGLVNLC